MKNFSVLFLFFVHALIVICSNPSLLIETGLEKSFLSENRENLSSQLLAKEYDLTGSQILILQKEALELLESGASPDVMNHFFKKIEPVMEKKLSVLKKIISFSGYVKTQQEIVSLDDPRFDDAITQIGEIDRYEYENLTDSKIYLLKNYDPSKIPLLFVHGFFGSPYKMRKIIEQTDQSKFQAWVYSYPSSEQIESVSERLLSEIIRLHDKYEFPRMVLTAHSLGGLVTRSMLCQAKKQGKNLSFLKNILTISSPHHGVYTKYPETYKMICFTAFSSFTQAAEETYAGSSLITKLDQADYSGFSFHTFSGTAQKDIRWKTLTRFIPGEDDGLVTPESAWLDGARNHLVDEDHHTVRENTAVGKYMNSL